MKTITLISILITLILFSVNPVLAGKLNLDTGEYTIEFDNGNKMNIDTGEYTVELDNGDELNLDTGEYTMELGDGDESETADEE